MNKKLLFIAFICISLIFFNSCTNEKIESIDIKCISEDNHFFTIKAEYSIEILSDSKDGKTGEIFDEHLNKLIGSKISTFLILEAASYLYVDTVKVLLNGSLIEELNKYLSSIEESEKFNILWIKANIISENQ